MAIHLSVIICTYNRCESLADTLESMKGLAVPAGLQWEIIVVDNNSKDDTRGVVERFRAAAPTTTKYVFEQKQGLSQARNSGVRASDGDVLLFTDDDVIVDRQWMAAIARAFETHRADCVGGKVVPLWLEERPRWLGDSLLNVLAMLDYGDDVIDLGRVGEDRCLFGASMAFKREQLIALGLFNTEMGRKGAFGLGEDKEIQDRLRALGRRIIYEPAAVVLHKVQPERMTKSYFRRWHYSAGKDRAMIKRESGFHLLGIESYLLWEFLNTTMHMFGSAASMNWNKYFEFELRWIRYVSVFKHKVVASAASAMR